MARDASLTVRTRRNIAGCLCIGQTRRSTEVVASLAAQVTGGITSINTSTFGFFRNAAFSDSCVATATDATLTSTDLPWTAADVGKTIHIAGAGTAGGTHTTTIASYTSAGEIELTDVAVTTTTATSSSATGLAVWGDLLDFQMDDEKYYSADGTAEKRSSSITASATGALLVANNLSDLQDAATARSNLGLGAASLLATTNIFPGVSVAIDTTLGNTNGLVLVDTTAGNITITLPPTPTTGLQLNIKKIAAANTVTIARNGNNIDGAAADLSLTTDMSGYTLQFFTGFGWAIL